MPVVANRGGRNKRTQAAKKWTHYFSFLLYSLGSRVVVMGSVPHLAVTPMNNVNRQGVEHPIMEQRLAEPTGAGGRAVGTLWRANALRVHPLGS